MATRTGDAAPLLGVLGTGRRGDAANGGAVRALHDLTAQKLYLVPNSAQAKKGAWLAETPMSAEVTGVSSTHVPSWRFFRTKPQSHSPVAGWRTSTSASARMRIPSAPTDDRRTCEGGEGQSEQAAKGDCRRLNARQGRGRTPVRTPPPTSSSDSGDTKAPKADKELRLPRSSSAGRGPSPRCCKRIFEARFTAATVAGVGPWPEEGAGRSC